MLVTSNLLFDPIEKTRSYKNFGFSCRRRDLNPYYVTITDFESAASAIPPRRLMCVKLLQQKRFYHKEIAISREK